MNSAFMYHICFLFTTLFSIHPQINPIHWACQTHQNVSEQHGSYVMPFALVSDYEVFLDKSYMHKH